MTTPTEWIDVPSKKNKNKNKNKRTFYVHKKTGPRFNFDFNDSQPKNKTISITENEFPEFSSLKKKTGGSFFNFNDTSKNHDSWAVKLELSVETPKTTIPVIKPKKSDPEKATYLYDWEVEKLCRTMNWGDFEVMMDDVIIIPDNEQKP